MAVEVTSQMTGSVWKVTVNVGQHVEEDEVLVILESMKMEIPILATVDGIIKEILVQEEGFVSDGDVVVLIEEE